MAEIATWATITADEQSVIQAIAAGTYFVNNITPTGSINDVNTTFTLPSTPNPTASLELRLNGLVLRSGASNDFTLSGAVVTMAVAPASGDTLTASYTVSPI